MSIIEVKSLFFLFSKIIPSLPKVKRPILGGATWELPAGGISGKNLKKSVFYVSYGKKLGFRSSTLPSKTGNYSDSVQNRLPMFPSIFSTVVGVDEFDQRTHDHEVDSVVLSFWMRSKK